MGLIEGSGAGLKSAVGTHEVILSVLALWQNNDDVSEEQSCANRKTLNVQTGILVHRNSLGDPATPGTGRVLAPPLGAAAATAVACEGSEAVGNGGGLRVGRLGRRCDEEVTPLATGPSRSDGTAAAAEGFGRSGRTARSDGPVADSAPAESGPLPSLTVPSRPRGGASASLSRRGRTAGGGPRRGALI